MKTLFHLSLCAALLAVFAIDADGAKPKKRKQFTPPPTPTPAGAPSGDLSRFISANLETILGPLEPRANLPKAELAQMRDSFSQRFAKATLAERNQYQAAIAVCDALSQAMTERATATNAVAWTQRAAQHRTYIEQLVARQKALEGQPGPNG